MRKKNSNMKLMQFISSRGMQKVLRVVFLKEVLINSTQPLLVLCRVFGSKFRMNSDLSPRHHLKIKNQTCRIPQLSLRTVWVHLADVQTPYVSPQSLLMLNQSGRIAISPASDLVRFNTFPAPRGIDCTGLGLLQHAALSQSTNL